MFERHDSRTGYPTYTRVCIHKRRRRRADRTVALSQCSRRRTPSFDLVSSALQCYTISYRIAAAAATVLGRMLHARNTHALDKHSCAHARSHARKDTYNQLATAACLSTSDLENTVSQWRQSETRTLTWPKCAEISVTYVRRGAG